MRIFSDSLMVEGEVGVWNDWVCSGKPWCGEEQVVDGNLGLCYLHDPLSVMDANFL